MTLNKSTQVNGSQKTKKWGRTNQVRPPPKKKNLFVPINSNSNFSEPHTSDIMPIINLKQKGLSIPIRSVKEGKKKQKRKGRLHQMIKPNPIAENGSFSTFARSPMKGPWRWFDSISSMIKQTLRSIDNPFLSKDGKRKRKGAEQ